jgi:thioesterase domain-containing protein
MIWYLVSIFWCLISIVCHIFRLWSYANTIETAVLLVIVYDIVWHRINAVREAKRDEEVERRTIEREVAQEMRQLQRERRESLRRHWQDLQHSLISLSRVASNMATHREYILKNQASQDATIRAVLSMMTKRLPVLLAEYADRWGRVVSQINVFPAPKDDLALEIQVVVEELGKTIGVGGADVEIKDETLSALASFVLRAADKATLPNVDE